MASVLPGMVTSVGEIARRFIEAKIVRGELRPGEKVTEAQIADELSISRSPVREAFSSLEAKGLLDQKPRRGFFVSDIDETYIWEIYTLQNQFYVLGLTLSWDRIGEKEIAELEACVERMEEIAELETCVERMDEIAASNAAKIEEYQEINHRFHLIPIILSGHQRLLRHANDYNAHVKRLSYMNIVNEVSHLGNSAAFHRQIFEAIRSRDLDGSVQLIHQHVHKGLEVHLARYGKQIPERTESEKQENQQDREYKR